ncbi:MAG: hypothetical protein ACXWCB_16970 [Acidimicrobiales bacterium]
MFVGFPPLHYLASASDLIAFRDRINAAAAAEASCPGYEPSPERLHPAEIDWIGRRIRLRHARGEVAAIPATLRYTAAEKQMLGAGPLLASVGCPDVAG